MLSEIYGLVYQGSTPPAMDPALWKVPEHLNPWRKQSG
jgi:hypothetical protein